jgi:5-(carboxyamino)imidazole ribonucleotide synthase
MVNVIGAVPDTAVISDIPGAHLHLYGKEPRPGRKLGHVTIVAEDPAGLGLDRLRAAGLEIP